MNLNETCNELAQLAMHNVRMIALLPKANSRRYTRQSVIAELADRIIALRTAQLVEQSAAQVSP